VNAVAFADADRLYRLAEAQEIHYYHVRHADFERFSILARRLRRDLQRDNLLEDERLARFDRVIQRYRFNLSLAPLAFNAAAVAPRLTDQELGIWLRQTRAAYPDLAPLATELTALLAALRRDAAAPLLDELARLAGGGGALAVVLTDSRLVAPSREALNARLPSANLQVLSALGLRGADVVYDRLFAVGSPRWYPPFVFAAPRAADFVVVAYAWQRDQWRAEPAFRAGITAPRPRVVLDVVPDDADDRPPAVDWSLVEHRSGDLDGGREAEEVDDIAEARLFTLQGGQAVLLEVGARRSLVIDLDDDEAARVKRVDANAIEPGMFVLLRTEGGGDYIVPLADQILGERAEGLRQAQRFWKTRLAELVRRRSLGRVAAELTALGASRADEGNARRWTSPRNIRTQDRADFNAIMRLSGLANAADEYWDKMGIIRGAHQSAGRVIMEQLLDQVRRANLTTLSEEGTMDFTLPGTMGGRLTAYRVEMVAPTTTIVAASRLNRPFEWEE